MEQRLEEFVMDGPVVRPGPGAPEPRPPVLGAFGEHELEPAARDRSFIGRLTIAEWLLKHREYLLAQIEGGREVPVILADLLLVAIVPTAFYGLVTGLATHSWVRILTNPIKLPLVLIFTMVLCLPTLYIFSSYLGSRRSILQTAALGFTSLAILGVVLAAFAPITWFLTFTAPHAYALHVLVNVLVLALAGFTGVGFLIHGTRRLHPNGAQAGKQLTFLWMWIVLYGLVGLEMGWLMSPFFSASNELISVRGPKDETVFQAVLSLIPRLFQ